MRVHAMSRRFCFLAAIIAALPPFLSAFSSTSSNSLGKKSTALDVLEQLNRSGRLASYVQQQQIPSENSPTESSWSSSSSNAGVAWVTGGNSGIGAVAVKTLAMTGMKVIMCARDVESAEKVVKEQVPAWCRESVSIQQLDLADMDSIQQAANEIDNKFDSIDVLLHNAGVMATPKRMETAQGLELQFGTNHVGHHMLTRLLLKKLNENGRVVTVASTAHTFSKPNQWDAYLDKDNYSPWGAYGQSKLANVVFAKGLQEQLNVIGRDDIKSVSLHPGVIRTNLWRHSNMFLKPLTRLFADKTIDQGAATSVYCCLVSDVTRGAYYMDCAEKLPTDTAQDASLRQQLWEYTEDLINEKGYSLPKMEKTEPVDLIAHV